MLPPKIARQIAATISRAKNRLVTAEMIQQAEWIAGLELNDDDRARVDAAMDRLELHDLIEPHHLHGYFVSTKGEFRLERLPGNRTRLSGTTWYYQRMSPRAYWDIWGDYIVGQIHTRVLKHIRRNVE